MRAIEDDPLAARRAGIGQSLIDIACGLDWDRSSRDMLDDGFIFALSRLRAICRYLTGRDVEGCGGATRLQDVIVLR
jgi:hypothetical protein